MAAVAPAAGPVVPAPGGRRSTGNLSFHKPSEYHAHFAQLLSDLGQTADPKQIVEKSNGFLLLISSNPIADTLPANQSWRSPRYRVTDDENPINHHESDQDPHGQLETALSQLSDSLAPPWAVLMNGYLSALKALAANCVGRASKFLESLGIVPLSASVKAKLQGMYPGPYNASFPAPQDQPQHKYHHPCPNAAALRAFASKLGQPTLLETAAGDSSGDTEKLRRIIAATEKGKGGGDSRCTMDTLKSILRYAKHSRSIYNGLIHVINTLNSAQILTDELLTILRTRRGVPLNKDATLSNPRPIGIGEFWLNLAAKAAGRSRRPRTNLGRSLRGPFAVATRQFYQRRWRNSCAFHSVMADQKPGARHLLARLQKRLQLRVP